MNQYLWIAREPVEGSRRFRLPSTQQVSSYHAYQCHYELPVTLKTHEQPFLNFFKSTKSYVKADCAANRLLIQFTLTCSGRKRGPQVSPDD